MDIATLGLRVDGTGAIRTMDRFTDSSARASRAGDAAEKTARGLTRALAAMGITLGAREVIGYADSWNLVEARIGLVTTSTRQQTAVQQELFAVAQRTRTEFENVATLYTKTARNAAQLGATQRQLIDFTETVGKGFIVSGASVGEMNAAVLQLGQALASGRLQGDELRSVLENAPRLAEAIATGMGVTIGKLREMGKEGQLTSKAIFDAVLSQRERIEAEFQRMPATIGQSFTVLNNELRRYIGGADDASGASQVLGGAILFVAKHLGALMNLVGLATVAWVGYTVSSKAASLASAAMAAIQAEVAATAVAEGVAVKNSTAALVGYESAAVAAGIASGGAAAGMGVATVAATGLTLAGRGLVSVLLGPVGIALALATVVAGLVAYRRASDEARRSTDEFRASLIGKSKTELLVTEADLDRQVWETERRIDQLRQQGQDLASGRQKVAAAAVQALTGPMDLSQTTAPLLTQSPEMIAAQNQLDLLGAQQAALQEQKEALATLDVAITANTKTTEDSTAAERRRLKTLADVREALAAMVRESRNELSVSELQGMAQREAQERFAAANGLLRLRADLQEKVISRTITQADADRLATEASEAFATSLGLRLDAMQRTALLEARQSHQDRIREAQQEIGLAGRYGLAQERLRVQFEATNRAIEARRTLTGETQAETLRIIETEARMEQRMVAFRRAVEDIGSTANEVFQRIFEGGIRTFGDLLSTIKSMITRTLAEIATDRFMRDFGTKLANTLAGAIGGGGAGAAASAVGAVVVAANAPRTQYSNYPTGSQGGSIALPGITATARQSQAANREAMKQFAGYLGAALAGASLGQMFGYSSGSQMVGALAGGLGGAATGFMMGGPVGAIIGGVAGLATGILGARKRHEELLRMQQEVLNRNNERLHALRESINGSPLLSGKNLAAAARYSGGLGSLPLFGGFLGPLIAGRFGGVGTKELAEALKGGESSRNLKLLEQQFGITAQQIGRMAREMGIELFDSAGKLIPDALKQLDEAIRLTIQAATQFGKSLDDIRLKQDAYNRLFDVPDTPTNQLRDAQSVLEQMAPDLLKQVGIANLDLSSEAARNTFLAGLREIYNLISSGALTPELLGSFTDKGQLIDAILRAKDGLDAFRQSLGDVTTDFPKAMDLILYEQRYGKGAGMAPGGEKRVPALPSDVGKGGAQQPGGATGGRINMDRPVFQIYVGSEATGRRLLGEIEAETLGSVTRGGFTVIPGAVTEDKPL